MSFSRFRFTALACRQLTTGFVFRRAQYSRAVLYGLTGSALATTWFVSKPKIYSDAEIQPREVVDQKTSISFPKVMKIPSKIPIPSMELVGLGVRTVSFLGIKVYSIALYADLNDPNLKICPTMNPEEKIEHLIRNTTCVIRIVPTRSTSYTHLRDAFLRALNTKLIQAMQLKNISEDEAIIAGSPLRQLKTLFPNSLLKKHEPLDILLMAPIPGRPRVLVFRDLGSIENTWVATEFFLHYFQAPPPSPALLKSVTERMLSFNKQ